MPKQIGDLISQVFKREAFKIDQDPSINELNFEHFVHQFLATYKLYNPLLKLSQFDESPCETCLEKIMCIFNKKWKIREIEEDKETSSPIIWREDIIFFKKIASSYSCKRCENKIRKLDAKNQPFDFLKANEDRKKKILEKFEDRKKAFLAKQDNLSIHFQIETQKEYLLKCLVHLEKKLLSDHIFKLNYQLKNGLVEIQLTKQNLKFNIAKEKLLEMDKYRENSLFRIGKTAFKCYRSLYSYNVRLLESG